MQRLARLYHGGNGADGWRRERGGRQRREATLPAAAGSGEGGKPRLPAAPRHLPGAATRRVSGGGQKDEAGGGWSTVACARMESSLPIAASFVTVAAGPPGHDRLAAWYGSRGDGVNRGPAGVRAAGRRRGRRGA